MNPPIHHLFTRTVTEDCEIDGYFIPKNTMVGIAIEAVNKNPDSWDKPDEFIPERFINEKKRKNKLFSYMPFSVGPRRCIGDKFSLLEQKCLIGKLLLKYKIHSKHSNKQDLPLSKSSFAVMFKQPESFSLKFTPRK